MIEEELFVFSQVVRATIDNDDDDDSPLQCLAELAESTPKMLRQNLGLICQICMHVRD